MKKPKNLLKNDYGMTLIETIIGILLIAMASLMLVTGFMTAFAMVKESTDLKNESAIMSTDLDLDKGKSTPEDITITTSKGTVKLSGNSKYVENIDKDKHFYVYVSDGVD